MRLPELEEFEKVITEIQSLRQQWESEVGRGRRAWPKAIKLRILELVFRGDFSVKDISNKTGVSYETINLWKHKAKKKNLEIPGFHQLAVESCNKSATVTVAESVMQPFQSSGRINVKTPKGYIFEGLSSLELAELIKCLGGLRVL
jgi:transposase-like protein